MKTMLRVFLVIDDYNELLYLQALLKKLGFDTEGIQNTRKYYDVSLGFNPQVLIATARGHKVNGLELIRTLPRTRGLPKVIVLKSPEDTITPQDIEALGIDMVLESPTSAKKLIMALANIADLDVNALLDKYNKMKATAENAGDADDVMMVSYDETGREVDVKPKMFSLAEDREIGRLHEPVSKTEVQFPLKKEPIDFDPGIETVDLNLGTQTEQAPLVDPEAAEARRRRYEEFLANAEKPESAHFDRDSILELNKKIRGAEKPEDLDEIERDRKEFVRALYEKPPQKSD